MNRQGATRPGPGRAFRPLRPGRLDYETALQLQERLLEERCAGEEDILILLEHPPVITLGRGADTAHLLESAETLGRRGIALVQTGRGGDVTYHGPGQLVGYPIFDLAALGRDLHRFLRLLEEALIDTLAAFGLRGERCPGKTGVWVAGAKIASIGIGVRRWVSWHGFALNVGTDLSGFDAIIPCGLPGVTMTSMERLTGRPIPLAAVEDALIRSFAKVFHLRPTGAP